MQNKEKNVKKIFFDNLLGAVVHTILCDNKVQPDLFSHAKWDETSFIIHVPVNTCLTGLSMEEQYHQPEGCRDRIKMTWKKMIIILQNGTCGILLISYFLGNGTAFML